MGPKNIRQGTGMLKDGKLLYTGEHLIWFLLLILIYHNPYQKFLINLYGHAIVEWSNKFMKSTYMSWI